VPSNDTAGNDKLQSLGSEIKFFLDPKVKYLQFTPSECSLFFELERHGIVPGFDNYDGTGIPKRIVV